MRVEPSGPRPNRTETMCDLSMCHAGSFAAPRRAALCNIPFSPFVFIFRDGSCGARHVARAACEPHPIGLRLRGPRAHRPRYLASPRHCTYDCTCDCTCASAHATAPLPYVYTSDIRTILPLRFGPSYRGYIARRADSTNAPQMASTDTRIEVLSTCGPDLPTRDSSDVFPSAA